MLSRVEDGKTQLVKSIAIDNLAASGDYYQIPTVSFQGLVYGTYSVTIFATAASTATGTLRYEYYIDGIRVYNPLGSTTNYQGQIIKDAYGLETNAVFTEIRDVLLDYGDFNTGMPDDTEGKMGAVFIDWVQPGQEGEGDRPGQELPGVTGQPTYNVGTFELYGPKNEVYLSAGQAIVLHVEEGNTYYVGLKTIDFIVEGLEKGKAAMIITENPRKLSEALSRELKRGITLWDSTGYYSGADKKMLYVVVNRFEIAKLKAIVKELDPKAFVSIMEVSEIMGESKMYRKRGKTDASRPVQLSLPVDKAVNSAPVSEENDGKNQANE
jgi:hypothetical protein